MAKANNPENSDVHFRIGFEEAISSKKHVLAGQLDILNLLKGINEYANYRRMELKIREDLKKESGELAEMIGRFKASLPNIPENERMKIRENIDLVGKREILQSDLDQIKGKLSRLRGF